MFRLTAPSESEVRQHLIDNMNEISDLKRKLQKANQEISDLRVIVEGVGDERVLARTAAKARAYTMLKDEMKRSFTPIDHERLHELEVELKWRKEQMQKDEVWDVAENIGERMEGDGVW